MRKAGCVLLVGALAAAGCQRTALDAGGADGSAPPPDLGVQPPSDLAPTSASDLGPATGADLLPPPETVAVCPEDQQMDSGTNTVVRVHAAWLIDHTTLSPTSLVVQLAGAPVAGSVAVSGPDLVFTSTAPLAANVMLQATLAGDVRDTLKRPLAPGGKTWTFFTGAGPQPTVGFKFTPPVCPYLGDHALEHAVARDDAQTVIAWSTGNEIVATSLDADASDFVNPEIVSHVDIGLSELSVTAVDGVARFAYVMNVNSDLVYWSRAADDWKSPYTEALLTTAAGYNPSVAAATGGSIAIAWDVITDEFGAATGYVTTSSDGGGTFSTPRALDTGSLCPQVLYASGRLIVAWVDTGASGQLQTIKAMSSSDNGATFAAPVSIADSPSGVWCPELVDAADGDVLFVYNQGSVTNGESVMLGRYTAATGAVAAPMELYPPEATDQCAYLAASPSGKLVLGRSLSNVVGGDLWTTELRTSDDQGQTFGAPTTPDVVDAHGGCPLLTYTDDAQVTMAWRRDYYQLQVSRGHPRRPCE
jgi:hypothetical protein